MKSVRKEVFGYKNLMLLIIALVFVFALTPLVFGIDFNFSSPNSVEMNKNFSVSISATTTDVYDVKIYVQDNEKAKTLPERDTYISEIYENNWRDPWEYIDKIFPETSDFNVKVINYSDDSQICVKLRNDITNVITKNCAPIEIQQVISKCTTINSEGSYVLNQSITTNSTCITIGANNIVLDCNGHTIDGTNKLFGKYGINNNGYDNITIKNCIITNFSLGIYAFNMFNSLIEGNSVSGNSNGIRLNVASNNALTNNIAESNTYGFYLSSSPNNKFVNNSASLNSNSGIFFISSSNNNFTNNNATGNLQWDFNSQSNSLNNRVVNFITQQNVISFIGKDIKIKGITLMQSPAEDPDNYRNINKYIGAVNTSATSWLFLNFLYTAEDIAGIGGNSLGVWKYNNNWEQVAGTNVSVVEKVVYANITDFTGGLFAPFGMIIPIIINYTNFDGNTTDFSSVDLSNIENLTLEKTSAGKIIFSVPISINSPIDIDSAVSISQNIISINSIMLPGLNRSALIYFYNVGFTTPKILLEGVDCPSNICTQISYSAGTAVYNVTGFSEYSLTEGYIAPATTSGDGGGGGGGGCVGSWNCSDWSSCINETQTRTCIKTPSYCYVAGNKPAETQICFVPALNATSTNFEKLIGGGLAGITGAVIGTLGKDRTILIIAFVVGLIWLAVVLHFRKHKKRGLKK